jgi:hypothetical protein
MWLVCEMVVSAMSEFPGRLVVQTVCGPLYSPEPGIYYIDAESRFCLEASRLILETIGKEVPGGQAAFITDMRRGLGYEGDLREMGNKYPELTKKICYSATVTHSAMQRMAITALSLGLRVLGVRMGAFSTIDEALAESRKEIARKKN